eukprot:6193549-Pleurochrysis_carterae.AAC.2
MPCKLSAPSRTWAMRWPRVCGGELHRSSLGPDTPISTIDREGIENLCQLCIEASYSLGLDAHHIGPMGKKESKAQQCFQS